jgi:hypothetical protein
MGITIDHGSLFINLYIHEDICGFYKRLYDRDMGGESMNKKLKTKGGSLKKTALKAILNNLKKPENLNIIKIIKPSKIPLDLIARLKCFQCG